MKKDEFIWAIRRLTGDRPATQLVGELRDMLRRHYGVGMFTDIANIHYTNCLADAVHVVRTFEIRALEERRDRVLADLAAVVG